MHAAVKTASVVRKPIRRARSIRMNTRCQEAQLQNTAANATRHERSTGTSRVRRGKFELLSVDGLDGRGLQAYAVVGHLPLMSQRPRAMKGTAPAYMAPRTRPGNCAVLLGSRNARESGRA